MSAIRTINWAGPGWSHESYTGPVKHLGWAIPREIPSRGPKAWLYHFAFGYASGFPLKHVLYWSTMVSFFPKRAHDLAMKNRKKEW